MHLEYFEADTPPGIFLATLYKTPSPSSESSQTILSISKDPPGITLYISEESNLALEDDILSTETIVSTGEDRTYDPCFLTILSYPVFL